MIVAMIGGIVKFIQLFSIPVFINVLSNTIEIDNPSTYLRLLKTKLFYLTLLLFAVAEFVELKPDNIAKLSNLNQTTISLTIWLVVSVITNISLFFIIVREISLKNIEDFILRQDMKYLSDLSKNRMELSKKVFKDAKDEKFSSIENTNKVIETLTANIDDINKKMRDQG